MNIFPIYSIYFLNCLGGCACGHWEVAVPCTLARISNDVEEGQQVGQRNPVCGKIECSGSGVEGANHNSKGEKIWKWRSFAIILTRPHIPVPYFHPQTQCFASSLVFILFEFCACFEISVW